MELEVEESRMSEEDEFAVITRIWVSLKKDAVAAADVKSGCESEDFTMVAAELDTTAGPDELKDGIGSMVEFGAPIFVDPSPVAWVNGTDSDDRKAVGIEFVVIAALISLKVKGNNSELDIRSDALLGSMVGGKAVVLMVVGLEYPNPFLVFSDWLTHKRSVHWN